jgi:hypothetical protein
MQHGKQRGLLQAGAVDMYEAGVRIYMAQDRWQVEQAQSQKFPGFQVKDADVSHVADTRLPATSLNR